jgi:hypothetical protein
LNEAELGVATWGMDSQTSLFPDANQFCDFWGWKNDDLEMSNQENSLKTRLFDECKEVWRLLEPKSPNNGSLDFASF